MNNLASTGSLDDLRDQVEQVSQDETIDAASRTRLLGALREELVGILGAIDTYLAGLDRYRTAEAHASQADLDRARRLADARDDLLAEGFSTVELEEAGVLDHEELDNLAEEGLLHATVAELAGRWREAPEVSPPDLMGAIERYEQTMQALEGRDDPAFVALRSRLAAMEKGDSIELSEAATISRSTGETGRYKLRIQGERVRRITGPAAAARLVIDMGVEHEEDRHGP